MVGTDFLFGIQLNVDEMGVRVYKDIPVVSSRDIAEVFDTDHNRLLRDLRKAKEDMQNVAV